VIIRLVRLINVSIAILALLILAAVYWYAIRPLPQTSGKISAPITGSATVRRDARGIPHIEASSWQDAIFLQGYVTAQDRLWQMDGLRRFGAGEISEIAGKGALAIDERSRRMRMRLIAEADVQHLRPQERAVFTEYARGVNYFIQTHRGQYSLEFSLPGHTYNPRPWSLSDTILVGLVMFRDLTDSFGFDFGKGNLLAGGDASKVRVLFPSVQGQMESPGSNAWAVSGAHSADGKPMLANDPHLAYGIPPTWHLVHLKAPGLNVSGASLPGVPGVITGHNEQIAWGVTNLQEDCQDLYLEQLDARNGHYIYQGHLEQAQLDRQKIVVPGAKPVEIDTWVTRHGPVVIHESGKSYSLRWSAADGFGFPFLDIDRAQNWQQFRSAVSTFWGPPQNFVYADKAGNIGYQASGYIPIRRGFDGDAPLDGSSGKFEWDGYVPFDQMPSVYNPPSGIVATANQNPFPKDFAYRISGSFADKYRVEQIRALLQAKNKLTVDDMLAVQKDVYSAFHHYLAKQIVKAFDHRGSANDYARQAIQILRDWNGQMDKDEAAPFVTELVRQQLGDALVQCAAMEPAGRNLPDIRPRPQVVESLLRERPVGWITGDDWEAWLLTNLTKAMERGRTLQGSPVAHWKWGRIQQWKFAHPLGNALPVVNRFFNIGPVAMSGAGTTVKQTTTTLGPSERMVVDFGDLDRSVQNLTTGESGFVASSHYKDEWPAYYAGKSFPMQFEHVDAKEVLQVKPGRP
jgi:penicillin amidase